MPWVDDGNGGTVYVPGPGENPDAGVGTATTNQAPASGGGGGAPLGTYTAIGPDGQAHIFSSLDGRDLGLAVRSGSTALSFDQQMALATAPRSSSNTSSSTSNSTSNNFSHADPAQLQQQLEIATQQHDDTMAQITATRAKNAADAAAAVANLDFLKSKEQYAQAASDKQLTLTAQQQAFGQQQAIVGLQLQASQIATQQAQISADFQIKKAQTLAQLATDIGTTAQNPIDYGKYVATLQASRGIFGSSAPETQDNITSNSLQPLQSLLGQRDAVQANHGPQFSPINLGTLAPTTTGVPQGGGGPAINPDFLRIQAQNQQNANVAAVAPTQQNTDALVAGDPTALGNLIKAGFTPAATNANGDIPAAKDGGMMGGAYISGEEGPEINFPNFNGTGKTLILNAKEAQGAGIDLKQIVSGKGKGSVKMFAGGGIFDAGSILNPDTGGDTTQAQDFLTKATQTATAQTPWGSTPPTSVYFSSPGTSPVSLQVAASIRQMLGLAPASETERLAQLYQPNGYHFSSYAAREMPVGRTA